MDFYYVILGVRRGRNTFCEGVTSDKEIAVQIVNYLNNTQTSCFYTYCKIPVYDTFYDYKYYEE